MTWAGGTPPVAESKKEAGVREVDVSPMLREILVLHRAGATHVGDDDYVFATRDGGPHNRNNVRCKMGAQCRRPCQREAGRSGTATDHGRHHEPQFAPNVR